MLAAGSQPSRLRWPDAALIAAVSVGAAFASGAQAWVGFNSPDSEFYASLALFGSDVADRAIEPAYTWTRLGYIAPVRGLTDMLGAWAGFGLWRFLLVLIIVGSVYSIVRRTSTREWAVIASAFASLSTMVLGFVGNTYLTGTILAALTALLALSLWGALGQPRHGWLPAACSGLIAAWLVMLNPYALFLGMTMWLAVRIVALVRTDAAWPARWRRLARDAAAGICGFVVGFAAFWLSGLAIFPGRDWFRTYLDWNARLDYSSFVGDPDVWQRDIALLVPLIAIAVALIAVVATRGKPAFTSSIAALAVGSASVAFTFAFIRLVPGPWLESPTYVAKLWPGAIVAAALATAALAGQRRPGLVGWGLAGAGICLTAWAGRWDRDLSTGQGLLIALAIVLAFAVAASLTDRWWALAVLVLALAIAAIGGQLLQNGRGLLGIYGQYPLRAAYVDFDAELLMGSRIAAEEWVLARTGPDDSIGIWTDPGRLTAGLAGMQLWGAYNLIGIGPTLDPVESASLEETRPSAIALYAPDREQITAFLASLPPWAQPSEPECTTVPYLGIGSPVAHVCVTHLDWLR
ncbi:MAG: hypothetical protein Q7V58_04650 [Actinomycetota bacterium]|nr:hypothetical protein [Actinomycetota bacterium]